MQPPPEPIPLDEPSVQNPDSVSDADEFSDEDKYINSDSMLTKSGEGMEAEKMIKRSTGPDEKVQVIFNQNKMLDTSIYDVIFMNGTTQQLSENRMALSMYEHVDSEGVTTKVMGKS